MSSSSSPSSSCFDNEKTTWPRLILGCCLQFLGSTEILCFFLSRQGKFIGNAHGPGNGPIWLDDVICRGNELSISECSHTPWGAHTCEHHEDVSITCYEGPPTIGNYALYSVVIKNATLYFWLSPTFLGRFFATRRYASSVVFAVIAGACLSVWPSVRHKPALYQNG